MGRWRIGAVLLASFATAPVPMAGSAFAPSRRTTARLQQQEADTSKITPAMVDAGRAIFHGKGTCFACHGMQLEGT
ncbi:MAG TPA: hypothetical protein VF368_01550, partial [Gemmatimonadaceae bacterium]